MSLEYVWCERDFFQFKKKIFFISQNIFLAANCLVKGQTMGENRTKCDSDHHCRKLTKINCLKNKDVFFLPHKILHHAYKQTCIYNFTKYIKKIHK